MAEIYVRCPRCRKKLAWRGVHGHLRFEHMMESGKASQVLTEMKPGIQEAEHRAQLLEAIGEHSAARTELDRIESVRELVSDGFPVIPPELWHDLKRAAEVEIESVELRMAELAVQWMSDRVARKFAEGGVAAIESYLDSETQPEDSDERGGTGGR